MKPGPAGYVPGFDGLRGLAILLVMTYHAKLLTGGFVGVEVFFVLSGYLITYLLIREHDARSRVDLKKFYARRALRLLPALLLLCAALVALSCTFPRPGEALRTFHRALFALFYAANWVIAFQWVQLDLFRHTWSLSIEEQFYFAWPLVLAALLRWTRSRWTPFGAALALALASALLRAAMVAGNLSPYRVYNGLDTRASALMLGCALGILTASRLLGDRAWNLLARPLALLAPVSVLALCALCASVTWVDRSVYYAWFLVIDACTCILILNVLANPAQALNRLLANRALVWLGSVSYGVYLWHYPINAMLLGRGLPVPQAAALAVLLTFPIVAASYYLVERPLQRRFKPLFQG